MLYQPKGDKPEKPSESACPVCDGVVKAIMVLSFFSMFGLALWGIWHPSQFVGRLFLTALAIYAVSSFLARDVKDEKNG